MNGAFCDPESHEWKVRLTVGAVADVKRETTVNLAAFSDQNQWVELLFGDPGRLVSVLWVLCEQQARERGITPERFGHLFDGPTLEAAGDALAYAIAGFFPRSRIGKALQTGLGQVMAQAELKAVAEIEAMVSTACGSPTSAPASSASIPAG